MKELLIAQKMKTGEKLSNEELAFYVAGNSHKNGKSGKECLKTTADI